MASNKIHLGNTKIVSDSEAPAGTVIATPAKSGTIALLSDVGGGASPVDTYTKTEIDAQQAEQNHDIADNQAATQTNSNRITKNEEDIVALEARPIGGETVDAYTKAEVDAQQDLQDIEIAKNAEAISNIPAPISTYSKDQIDSQQQAQDDVTATKANKIDVYTKAEVDAQQAEQDTEIVKKADKKDSLEDAPEDGETYARNNKTWVSISETSGIPDAPVDGKMYGRKDGEWDAVADAGDIYTKTEIDAQQSAQDAEINTNHTDIVALETKTDTNLAYIADNFEAIEENKAEVDASQLAQDTEIAKKADKETTYTKAQIDSQQSAQDTKIDKNIDDIQTNADAIAAIPAPIDSYTKAEVDASQNEQDTEILKKADKADVYTKTEMDTQQSDQDTKIDKNVSDVAKNTADITKYTADVAKNTADITKNTVDIAKNTADIEAMPPYVDAYTKTETNTLLDGKADKGSTGGGEAQPPVAFKANKTSPQSIPPNAWTKLTWEDVAYDDKNSFSLVDNNFIAPQDGVYQFNVSIGESAFTEDAIGLLRIDVNDVQYAVSQTSYSIHYPTFSLVVSVKLNSGDKVSALFNTGNSSFATSGNAFANWFSGHMISSITEGEVKEKEAVAFQAGISSGDYKVPSNVYEKIQFNAIKHDTNSFYDETNKEFTPTIEGYYLVTLNTRAEAPNLTRNLAVIFKNDAQEYGGTEIFDDTPVKNAITSVATGLVYCNGVDDSISGKVLAKTTDGTSITLKKNASTSLSIHLVTGQSTGGGSGGGETIDAPWEPHDYLYVNNCVPSPEEGKHWETFVPPQPGEVFFMGPGGMPVPNDSYELIQSIYISKYDNKGNELPFILDDFYLKQLKFASPDGSATFVMEQLISSDVAPEHMGYEGETFYIITIDTYEEDYVYTGTIVEGQIAQVTSPEEGKVIAEWEEKEYVSTDNPDLKITSVNTENEQIVVNRLAIGSSYNPRERVITNIMIGNEPDPKTPSWADGYQPGLHWNTSTSEGNISIGQDSLRNAENVTWNIAVGRDSLYELRNGYANTAIGFQAGNALASGDNNTFIGKYAGDGLSSGNDNTFIGAGATPKGGGDVSGQVVLGGSETQELWVGNNKVFPFPDDFGGGSGGNVTIEASYTNKHTLHIGDDPYPGNLYLGNPAFDPDSGADDRTTFVTDYQDVVEIYISNINGADEWTDYDQVVHEDDKVTLSSENGSGIYKVLNVSDLGGYTEIFVRRESAEGTIDNNTPISVVFDVQPSDGGSGGGSGGGVEEAPDNGKQYGRQNESWTEVVAIPEPQYGINSSTWGRKIKNNYDQSFEWARVKEVVAQWYNYKGEFYYGKDAPDAGCMSMDSLMYSYITAVKISTTEIPGTSVSTTPMKDRLKTLKVGDSIDVQTTHFYKNENHMGGGALEITGITEHDTYFEFTVNSNDKYSGAIEPGDGVAVLLPGEVANKTTDVYDYNLEVNGKLAVGDMTLVGPSYPDQTNIVCNSAGFLLRSSVTYYSVEEVDKKLAIKDKLIEKLSARLDALEKRMKK